MKVLEETLSRFKNVPRNLILKADLLRQGIRWEEKEQVGVRHYHHHDQKSQAVEIVGTSLTC